jgi:hypothetical protein
MTLMDLYLLAAPASNGDADPKYTLSRALLKLFPTCRTSRGSPPTSVTPVVSRLRGFSLPAPLREVLAIARGREGATS